MYNLNGKKKHVLAIPFPKLLYFVSTNFQELVIKLAAIRKTFANCKVKYLRKIVKIRHGRNLHKESENLEILQKFLPRKSLFF